MEHGWTEGGKILRLGALLGFIMPGVNQKASGRVVFGMMKTSLLADQAERRERQKEIEQKEKNNHQVARESQKIGEEIAELKEKLASYSILQLASAEKREERQEIQNKLRIKEAEQKDILARYRCTPHSISIWPDMRHLYCAPPQGEGYDPMQDCVHFESPRGPCPRCQQEVDYPIEALYPCPSCGLWQTYSNFGFSKMNLAADDPLLLLAYGVWEKMLAEVQIELGLDEKWTQEEDQELNRVLNLQWSHVLRSTRALEIESA